ncbi:MAG TPA: hypothetical protein VFJ47_03575 [Terriglobales bacterium]|nr:hypothetical protein [Terriglobales bacterium]
MAITTKSLRSSTRPLRDYGLSLLFDFYVVTRFTPTIVRILG